MVNTVVIIGKVADLKVTFDADGKPQTSFTLRYEQEYGEGKTAKLFVPVDAAPSRAESIAEAISDGDRVLVDGVLNWSTARINAQTSTHLVDYTCRVEPSDGDKRADHDPQQRGEGVTTEPSQK